MCATYKFFIFVFILVLAYILQQNLIYILPIQSIISGGFSEKQLCVKNVLIVDMANMYVGWYMEKNSKGLPYAQQNTLMGEYIDCMQDHYDKFSTKNNTETSAVNYILKNYKYSQGKNSDMSAPPITQKTRDKIDEFVKNNIGAHVTIAEDYTLIPHNTWKTPKNHYLRARDDYMCFRMAQYYKKKYIHAVIMTDDKFKDYEQFGFTPKFLATYIHTNCDYDVYNIPTVEHNSAHIHPKPNSLGQIVDYNIVKITTAFEFGDPLFLKNREYKISNPGHVWD
jgi:hypothetical protein